MSNFWELANAALTPLHQVISKGQALGDSPHKAARIDAKGRLVFTINYERPVDGIQIDRSIKIAKTDFTYISVDKIVLQYQNTTRYQLSIYFASTHSLSAAFIREHGTG